MDGYHSFTNSEEKFCFSPVCLSLVVTYMNKSNRSGGEMTDAARVMKYKQIFPKNDSFVAYSLT